MLLRYPLTTPAACSDMLEVGNMATFEEDRAHFVSQYSFHIADPLPNQAFHTFAIAINTGRLVHCQLATRAWL